MPDTRVEIRPPRLARAYVLVFMVVWCGLLVAAGARAASRNPASLVLVAVMLCLGLTIGYRLLTLSVVADGDALVAHNNLRTQRWARSDIASFVHGRSNAGVPWGSSVQVLLRDQSVVPLDVTQTALPGRRGQERLQQRLEALSAWHQAGAQRAGKRGRPRR